MNKRIVETFTKFREQHGLPVRSIFSLGALVFLLVKSLSQMRYQMLSLILSRQDNLAYSDNLRQNQQSYCRLRREDTNAIRPLNPCNNSTSYEPPFNGKDENGEWKTYLVEYEFNGSLWSILLPAYSWSEAQNRLQAIAQGKILGEIDGAIET